MGCARLDSRQNMNPNIEAEHIETEVLENNLKQIEELMQDRYRWDIPFVEEMPETQEINDVLHYVGFLREDMVLKSFHLEATEDGEGIFEFCLCFGVGEVVDSSKKFYCMLQYIKEEKYGDTVRRILQEEGEKLSVFTHCLFEENLKRLSNRDKKIFETLTLKFLEAR